MSRMHKVILIWAIMSTLLNLYHLQGPVIENVIHVVKWHDIESRSSIEQKAFLMEQVIEVQEPFLHLDKDRKLNALWERLVRVDSTDLTNLISYGTSCITLAANENDSLKARAIMEKSLWVVAQLRKTGAYDVGALMFAARLYTHNGSSEKQYYDTSDAIYDRIAYLIEIDSLKTPNVPDFDKRVWRKELEEALVDLRFYNRMVERSLRRKFIYIY